MKFLIENKLKQISFLILAFMSIALSQSVIAGEIAPTQDTPNETEIIRAIENKMEIASTQTLQSIDKLQAILLEIASAVQSKAINLTDPHKTIQQSANLRAGLELCKKSMFGQPNPATVLILNYLLQATGEVFQKWMSSRCTDLELLTTIAEPLLTWARSDFTEVPPAYLQEFIKRNPITDINDAFFDTLDFQLQKTENLMNALEKQSTTAGLRWWNKAFRTLENRVIDPLQKYHVPRLAGKLALTAGILILNGWLVHGHIFADDPAYKPTPQADALTSDPVDSIDVNTSGVSANGSPVSFVGKLLFNNATPSSSSGSGTKSRIVSFVGKLLHKVYGSGGPFGWMGQAPKYTNTTPTNKGALGPVGSLLHILTQFGAPNGIYCPQLLSMGAIIALWAPEVKSWYENGGHIKNFIINKLRGGEYNKQTQNGPFGNITSDITFANIIGNEDKKSYFNNIIKYLLYPERFDRADVKPERGILLMGEPGTGKTEFIKAFRGELALKLKEANRDPEEINFLTVPASLIMMNGIAWLINSARELAPCIVFVDEFDLLMLQRTGDNRNLSELLTFMNGSITMDPPKKRVILIGATNKVANIDNAVKRAGRFGKHIPFELPTVKELQQWLQQRLSGLALDPNEFDIARAAQEAAGCTFEDLQKAIRATILRTQTTGHPFNQASFEQSMDHEVRGIFVDDSADISQKEQEIVAVHMAGHILARELLHTPEIVSRVTTHRLQVKAKEETVWHSVTKNQERDVQKLIITGKTFTAYPDGASHIKSSIDVANNGKVLMAGAAAELVCLGDTFEYHVGHGEQNDRHDAFIIARSLLPGGSDDDLKTLSENKQNEIRDQAYNMVQAWQQEMIQLFKDHKAELDALIAELKDKRTLSSADIKRILHKDLPEIRTVDDVTGLPLASAVPA